MFTVITPVYNRQKELKILLDQFQREYEKNNIFEWIIIDDKSDDGTYELACEYAKKNCFTKVVASGFRSPGIARNLGAKHAKFNWLVYCDSDNIFIDGWSFVLETIISEHDDCMGIWFAAYENKKSLTSRKYLIKGDHEIKPWYYFNNSIGEVVHCLKREFLINNEYFYLKGHSNDFPHLLWFNIFSKYKVYFINQKIQNYSTFSKNRISTEVSMNKVESQLVHYYKVFDLLIKSKFIFSKYTLKIILKIIGFSLMINKDGLIKIRQYIPLIYIPIRLYQITKINKCIYNFYIKRRVV